MTQAHPAPSTQLLNEHPETAWFKTAVFYEVLVRAFYDSDGNGTGDFRGPDREGSTIWRGWASTASGCRRS